MKDKVIDHPGRRAGEASGLLRRIHQTACGFVQPLFDNLLMELDDELFQRADGALSDRVQQEYFDAMRTLRLERDALRTRFRDSLDTRLATREAHAAQVGRSGFAERIASLSLLADEALEQRLAVTTMSHRVERDCELELTLLTRRMEELTERDPACAAIHASWRPRQFAEAFAVAIEGIELGSEVRLVLFKIFEHAVLAQTTELYPRLNEFLSQAGVLPDLSPGNVRPIVRAAHPRAAAAAISEDHAHGDAAERQAPSEQPNGRSGYTGSTGASERGMRSPGAADTARILASLPGLGRHRRFSGSSGSAQGGASVQGQLLRVSGSTQRRLLPTLRAGGLDTLPARIDMAAALIADMSGAGMAPELAAPEEDVVNLLQMLFDTILRDDDMAIPMRALLARLQLPLLRVALADAAFIEDDEHHVRQFVNRLIDAGTGWARADERGQDRLYRIIEAIVDRLAQADASQFDGDAALVRELDADLQAALEREADAVRRVQERVIAQEQARIRADRTRQLVARLITHRANRLDDEVLRAFLHEEWQLVMLRAHQENAGRSDAWKSAFATLRRLTGGTGADGTALHAALCAGLVRIKEPAEAERTASLVLERLADVCQVDETERTASPASAAEPDVPAPTCLPAPACDPTCDEEKARRTLEQLPTRAAVERADALGQGDWLELQLDAERIARCRLAAVTEPPERCIFLNRRGVRIETLSRLELAEALESGRARELDTHQLFDTALETVIGGLRMANATA